MPRDTPRRGIVTEISGQGASLAAGFVLLVVAGACVGVDVRTYLGVPYLPARAVSTRTTSSITVLGARSRMVASAV
jgi:hypothetical protein